MTQLELILEYFDEFGSITFLEAVRDLGIMSLPRRIRDLKERGYHITKEMETSKNRRGKKVTYARYYLVKE